MFRQRPALINRYRAKLMRRAWYRKNWRMLSWATLMYGTVTLFVAWVVPTQSFERSSLACC